MYTRRTALVHSLVSSVLCSPVGRAAAYATSGLADIPASQAQSRAADEAGPGRFILVFLRGALDGLAALAPLSDPWYAKLRPTLALKSADHAAAAQQIPALQLDADWALHPALAPLLPLWQAKKLAFIQGVGLPEISRSHFEAQAIWEKGQRRSHHVDTGWMNRLAARHGPGPRTLYVGQDYPLILRGPAKVRMIGRNLTTQTRTMAIEQDALASLQRLYAQDPQLDAVFRSGVYQHDAARSLLLRAASHQAAGMDGLQAVSSDGARADNVLRDAHLLAQLLREDPRLRTAFIASTGWDTHAVQGASQGYLAARLQQLAQALLALHRACTRPHDVICVVSEFGRTVAENGTGGTDHGSGNMMMLLGPGVQGGRILGRFSGLAPSQLFEGRDMPIHHDIRGVLALILQHSQGLAPSSLAAVFPENERAFSSARNAFADLIRPLAV